MRARNAAEPNQRIEFRIGVNLAPRRLRARNRRLNIDSACDSTHDARKLHQHAIAGYLNDASVVFADFRVGQSLPQHLECCERACSSMLMRRL